MAPPPLDDEPGERSLATQFWLLRGLTLLAVLAMLGTATWSLWQERSQELGNAARQARRRADQLAADIERSLALGQVLVGQAEARLRRPPAARPPEPDGGPAPDERAAWLAALAVPFTLRAAETPAHGPAAALPAATASAADGGAPGWLPGLPVEHAGRRVLPLWRAAAPDLLPAGGWTIELDHDTLLRSMERLRDPDGGGVALMRVEGDGSATLLMRAPFAPSDVGVALHGPLAKALRQAPHGLFRTVAEIDGVRRTVAYRRLGGEGTSLVVVYGIADEHVLADWTAQLPGVVAVAVLLIAGMVVGAVRLEQSLRATERAHRAARRSERHFRALAGNLPDVVVRLDREGRHLYANPAVEVATGLPPERFLGRTNAELGMPESNLRAWDECLQRVVTTGQAERLEFSFAVGDRERHWESQVVPETDRQGQVSTVLVISRDVTQAHVAAAALRESEERLRLALEAAHQGLYDLDLRTGDAVVTPEYALMIGHDPASFRETNLGWRERLHPDDRDAVYAAFEDYVAGRRPDYRIEFRLRTRDGGWKWVLSLGKVQQRDAEGRPTRMLGTHTDITPFKRAQAALAESEARFRHLFERNPAPMFVYARGDLRILSVNEAFTRAYGYSARQALAMRLDALHVPAQRAALAERVATISGLADAGEWDHLTQDGRVLTAAVRSHDLVFDGQDARVVVISDVTERRRAEDEVRRLASQLEQRVQDRTAELARSEERLRKIFETVPIAIGEEDWSGVQRMMRALRDEGVTDGPGYFAARHDFVLDCLHAVRVLRLNRKALELHAAGPPPRAVQGLESFYPTPADLPQFIGELEAMWRGDRQHSAKKSLPALDGRPLNLMLTMSMPGIDDDDGTALVCLVDITEVDRLNAELDRSVARLRQVNRELETFTYSVSHDLKAPLRGIDGYSRLLLEDHQEQLDDEGRQFLAHIRRATQQMAVLIDDLLAYSRLERRELTLARMPLAVAVDTVLGAFRHEFADRGVRLEVAIDPELAVLGDAQGLALALRNLVDNALKFRRAGSEPSIELRATRAGDVVRLAVRDNGLGFDMKFHDRIFTIFQRLHRAEDYPGTGVGLAIVRKAMERMGGRVWADSSPGAGATFTLELPEAR